MIISINLIGIYHQTIYLELAEFTIFGDKFGKFSFEWFLQIIGAH